MKRLTLFALLFLASSLQVAKAQETISLERVLSDTKAYYPYLEKEDVLKSSLDNLEKTLWYAYIPQVSVNANVQYQTDVPSIAISMSEPGPEDDPTLDQIMGKMIGRLQIPEIPKLQYQTYAQVTQLLWSGNRVSAGAEMIRANIAQKSAEAKAGYEKAEDAVTELYFGLLMLDAQKKLQDNFLTEIARQKTKAENARSNGVATQNDLDEIELRRLKAEQQRDEIKESRASILHLIGLYTGKTYDPDQTEAEVPSEPLPDTDTDTATGSRYAAGRMTHQVLDAQVRTAKAVYDMSFADMLPSIVAFARGGYGKPGLNMFAEKGQPYFVYGLTFSWNFGNFYNLGTKKLDLENTRALVRLQRREFEINQRAKVEKLKSEAHQYETLIAKDEEIAALQRQISDRAALQQEAGTMTAPDRLEKLSALNAALQTRDVHKIQQLRALYMARRALGQ